MSKCYYKKINKKRLDRCDFLNATRVNYEDDNFEIIQIRDVYRNNEKCIFVKVITSPADRYNWELFRNI